MNGLKRFMLLAASFIFVLGVVAQAHALPAGSYHLYIEPTPVVTTGTTTVFDFGSDPSVGGKWNSLFTTGGYPESASTSGMIDNPSTKNGTGQGTGPNGDSPNIYGDGYAGDIIIDLLADGSFTVNQFQVDIINDTAGGSFAQYGPVGDMSGTILDGNISFDPTGRLASIDSPATTGRWNVYDPCSDGDPCPPGTIFPWITFTTGTVPGPTSNGDAPAGTISGSPIWTDSTGMYAVLVSSDQVGPDWGSFTDETYYEVWKVKIEAVAVPEPGSLLLIGSGLIGVIGLKRKWRK